MSKTFTFPDELAKALKRTMTAGRGANQGDTKGVRGTRDSAFISYNTVPQQKNVLVLMLQNLCTWT